MTRRDPASRDYSRARAALPIEQREVWGAPVRDGTCADDSDECGGCRIAPPLSAEDQAAVDALWADSLDARDPRAWDDDEPALVQGGQGRSDAATMSAGELASWIFVLGVSAAALFLVARWWGLV